VAPLDRWPGDAISQVRAWTRGEIRMMESCAAAYAMTAIKAVRAAASPAAADEAGRGECRWQREPLPDAIRELVLDDQWRRNDLCWSVFSD
jgi:hypothetical protein